MSEFALSRRGIVRGSVVAVVGGVAGYLAAPHECRGAHPGRHDGGQRLRRSRRDRRARCSRRSTPSRAAAG